VGGGRGASNGCCYRILEGREWCVGLGRRWFRAETGFEVESGSRDSERFIFYAAPVSDGIDRH